MYAAVTIKPMKTVAKPHVMALQIIQQEGVLNKITSYSIHY